jgi:L-threonylcarbamoyladenylate synthase
MTPPADDEIARAAAAALRGELVVLPTDTVYGIGTRPGDAAATGRLFEAKRRPRDLELPVLVASLAQAESVGVLSDHARALAKRWWPGALTIVVPRSSGAQSWDLGGDPATVGLRVPAGPTALALLERTGPLAVTSANRSGSPTPGTCAEVAGVFGDAVAVTLCADDEPAGTSSTVVDCTGERPVVLRPGAIPASEIDDAIRDGPAPSLRRESER